VKPRHGIVEPAQQLTDATNGSFRAQKLVMSLWPRDKPFNELDDFTTALVVAEDTWCTVEAGRLQVAKQGVDGRGPGTRRTVDRAAGPYDNPGQLPTRQRLLFGHGIDNAICGRMPPVRDAGAGWPALAGFAGGAGRRLLRGLAGRWLGLRAARWPASA
jgi:hypothetical protein